MALIRITNTDGFGLPFGGGMFGSFPISTGVRVIGIRQFSPRPVICLNGLGGALLGQGISVLPGPSMMLGLDGLQGSIFAPTQRTVRSVNISFRDALASSNPRTVTVYHYTSKEGLEGILRDRVIKASRYSGGDANFGEGVYFTTLSPDVGVDRLIGNNWDDRQNAFYWHLHARKCSCALEFEVPERDLKRQPSNRSVWIYEGDFRIDRYPYEIHRNVSRYG